MHVIIHYPGGKNVSDEQKRRADSLICGTVGAEKPRSLIQIDMIATERRNEDDGIRCIIFGLGNDQTHASALMKKIGQALADVFRRQIVVRDGTGGDMSTPVVIEDRRKRAA